MNSLVVKRIESKKHIDLEEVSRLLEEQTELQSINVINWEKFPYLPEVKFRIAHSNNQIWLKYYVNEQNILAARTEVNSSVSRDSCVEFFFDPLGDGSYYNFEFNCIGTPHLAYGPDRHTREFVAPKKIKQLIKKESSLGDLPFDEKSGGHQWEMTIVLPAEILTSHDRIKLEGLRSRSNFYKCGDDTSEKHYLSWNPVGTERPDFHRPEFFGTLIFE
ncbi:carbohydrate-binding family 9-like protein [Ulvibacterium marinum]|uniref:carbohydrate-binding family 9-like protein n=1 Tax=Ulvibacterium marinum TaxID=2419782 RepID=UPI002494DE11|nr:carbohydrate-binding family 9-like protein [Ulvibacterium marinum]